MGNDSTKVFTIPFLRVDPIRRDLSVVVIDVHIGKTHGASADALLSLRRAVTKWVRSSWSGARAYEESASDFNVGDLVSHLEDPSLVASLRTYGIDQITVRYLGDFKPYIDFDLPFVDPLLTVS